MKNEKQDPRQRVAFRMDYKEYWEVRKRLVQLDISFQEWILELIRKEMGKA